MKKVTLLVAAFLVFALPGTGCKKQEPPPPPMPPQGAPGAPQGEGAPPVEKKVVVSDGVKEVQRSSTAG